MEKVRVREKEKNVPGSANLDNSAITNLEHFNININEIFL